MKANWYFIENDETVGPITFADLAGRIRQSGQSPLVWTEGMVDWTEAESVPGLSHAPQTATRSSASSRFEPAGTERNVAPKRAAVLHRLQHEFFEYLMISAYLFVWYGALLLYKSAILHSDGIEFAPFGIAAVKALILGKFVLILHALKVGERWGSPRILLADIVKKSVLFFLFLSVLAVGEEMIAGYFHGRALRDVLGEIGGGTLQQVLATGVLMLLTLIPYFTYRLVGVRLGQGVLWKLLTERASAASP